YGNSTDRCERRFLKRNGLQCTTLPCSIGNRHNKVARYGDELRVAGVTQPSTSDPLANRQVSDLYSHGDHSSGIAIPEGQGPIQSVADHLQRRQNPLPTGLIQHLTDQVRPCETFPQQALTRKFSDHPLCPARNKGGSHTNENVIRLNPWGRHLHNSDRSRPDRLHELSHRMDVTRALEGSPHVDAP